MTERTHNSEATAPVLFVTHKTTRAALDHALREIEQTDVIAGAPVVLLTDRRVQPDPSLHSSLVPQPSDVLVEKGYCDAFLETPLDAELKARGVDRLIVCGIQTDFCVDTTCRSAASHGYEVLLVGNAHSTFDHEYLTAEQIVAHHNRVLRRLPAGRGSVAVIDAAEVAFA